MSLALCLIRCVLDVWELRKRVGLCAKIPVYTIVLYLNKSGKWGQMLYIQGH